MKYEALLAKSRRAVVATLTAGALAALTAAPTAAQPTLGTPSFPGPSMSAHPLPIIQSQKLDERHGWKHEWNVRTSAAAYLNDFYTNVYGGLHTSGVNYIAKNYNKGTPIRIIGASMVFPYPVMVREGGGIETIADLKGKTMGVPKGSYIYAYLTAVLKHHGIDPDNDVKLENVPIIQALQLFDRGDFDAVLVSPSPASTRKRATRPIAALSMTVRHGSRRSVWNTTASLPRISMKSSCGDSPSMEIDPDVRPSIPSIRLTSVDLPQPVLPQMQTISRLATAKLTSLTAVKRSPSMPDSKSLRTD